MLIIFWRNYGVTEKNIIFRAVIEIQSMPSPTRQYAWTLSPAGSIPNYVLEMATPFAFLPKTPLLELVFEAKN